MKKRTKIILKYLLIFILILLCILLYFSTSWGLKAFNFLDFDEILFQLTAPLEGTEQSIIDGFKNESLFPAIHYSFIILIILILFNIIFNVSEINIDIQLWNIKIKYDLKAKYIKLVCYVLLIISGLTTIGISLNNIGFYDYLERNFTNSYDLYKEKYVDPEKVKLTFPENKKNLIYIYVESLESSFYDEDNGGINVENPMTPLYDLSQESTNFSHSSNNGGFYAYVGTTFTTGSLVAQTSGVNLRINNWSANAGKYKTFIPGAYSLGDILKREGYNQEFMIGSDKSFGNRGSYFESHGNYYVYDYNKAIELQRVPRDYEESWGVEDYTLFEIAKEELTRLSNEDKPFNFSILTTDTHPPTGYVRDDCDAPFESKYSNAIYCSCLEINDFVRWIQKQDFYDNTTIIIAGDHLSTVVDYLDQKTNRYVYNLIINSSLTSDNTTNRDFSAMDMYPTTLAAMGVTIEGDRLGLGTNLYSDKKTLSEELGIDKYNKQLGSSSIYYSKNILKKSKKSGK